MESGSEYTRQYKNEEELNKEKEDKCEVEGTMREKRHLEEVDEPGEAAMKEDTDDDEDKMTGEDEEQEHKFMQEELGVKRDGPEVG